MSFKQSLTRRFAVMLIAASVATSGSVAVAAEAPENLPKTQATDEAQLDQQEKALIEALERLDPNSSPEEMAANLFPDNSEAQREVASALRKVDEQDKQDSPNRRKRAVPAALLPYLVVIGKCVVGAMGSATAGELVHLVRGGQRNTAEARVEALIGGCITGVVPSFLRPLAMKAKKPLAAAVLTIIIRWKS